MTAEQLDILQKVKIHYLEYKRNSTMDIPQRLYEQLQLVHESAYGRRIEPCGGCLITAIHDLLIHSNVGTE